MAFSLTPDPLLSGDTNRRPAYGGARRHGMPNEEFFGSGPLPIWTDAFRPPSGFSRSARKALAGALGFQSHQRRKESPSRNPQPIVTA